MIWDAMGLERFVGLDDFYRRNVTGDKEMLEQKQKKILGEYMVRTVQKEKFGMHVTGRYRCAFEESCGPER